MNAESIIKGRIAEHIVELLFEDSGYKVIRIGREGLLINVVREDIKNLNQSDSAGKIATAPSFAVIDKSGGNIVLVKVKFKGAKSSGRNIAHGIGQLQEYWPEAVLLVVTPVAPYFRIANSDGVERTMEKIFPSIKKEALLRFGEMVKKFL